MSFYLIVAELFSSLSLHHLYECKTVAFVRRLYFGTAFSLEMESLVHRIYLRVTVPLTNLHQNLDFVGGLGFFFRRTIALCFGGELRSSAS